MENENSNENVDIEDKITVEVADSDENASDEYKISNEEIENNTLDLGLNEDDFIDVDGSEDESEEVIVSNPEELLSINQEGLNWYIIQCFSLYEKKVQDRIFQMMTDELKDVVYRVLLPEEETVEIKNNERKEKIKKMFPGYLFVQMKPDETAWYLLRRLPGVAKLVGTRNEPTPVSEEEINRVLRQVGEKSKKIEVDFELNESIKVISGPFRGYVGVISEINPDRGKLKSLISIFGRETPVELDFDQVEKYVNSK